ncbi:T9SS type A sorting domain-containing protein [Prolixibacteraceae bacterium JC049]|nr:T9SS type A sorting domain-containing protein [Prolixibacteraceae bacterium JC049]
MKKNLLMFLLLAVTVTLKAQITSLTNNNWQTIGNTSISTIYSDKNNTDGVNDGAYLVNGHSFATGQGAYYEFDGTMEANKSIFFSTNLYNPNVSYVKLKIELYNVTDNRVLASNSISIWAYGSGRYTLSYTTQESDNGDALQVRYIRNDDGHTARDFAIDNASFNGEFLYPSVSTCNDLSFNWEPIGNTWVQMKHHDADNGDGKGDGALFIDGRSTATGQGVNYTFLCNSYLDQGYNLETVIYNVNFSWVAFKVELINLTDNVVRASIPSTAIGYNQARTLTLNYIATQDDINDKMQLRFTRTDDGNTARNFAIDYVKVNGTPIMMTGNAAGNCLPGYTPDIALTPATSQQISEIEAIYERHKKIQLSSGPPSSYWFNRRLNEYNGFNISGNGDNASTSTVLNERHVGDILKTFANYVKYCPDSPDVADIKQKAVNLISIVGKQFCTGTTTPRGNYAYTFHHYTEGVIPWRNEMSTNQKNAFGYTIGTATSNFEDIWGNYNIGGQGNSDYIYGNTDGLVGYGPFIEDDNKRVQYMKGVQRWLKRVLTPTTSRTGFLKVDGSSYHHWSNYVGYMYSFKPLTRVLYALGNSSFQTTPEIYQYFRDAMFFQCAISNDNRVMPMSFVGRNPHQRYVTTGWGDVANTAIAGGHILGLNHADPVLAGYANRVWGNTAEYNYTQKANFETGFYQFNYSVAGIFRKDNWVLSMAGFTRDIWGAEIYNNRNFYGRYQSYGTLEIIYPGSLSDNGFDLDTWDWNHNPGTTSILLPFNKLHARYKRADEKQAYNFAGSLAFQNKGNEVLSKVTGTNGLFAMKFKQGNGGGWSGSWYNNVYHDTSFTFRKSTFAFDDMILALGSDINNQHAQGNTITTLYQRTTDNNKATVVVNDTSYSSDATHTFTSNSDKWLISNHNTGFYIVNGSGTLTIKKGDQKTPNFNQNLNSDWSGNPTKNYAIGYLDHGQHPTEAGYEYVCLPATTSAKMKALATKMSSNTSKPYTVFQKDDNAHIVKHHSSSAWGFAFFETNSNLTHEGNVIKSNNEPCLVMYKEDGNSILLAMNNPNISDNDGVKTVQLTLHGQWSLEANHSDVSILSSNSTQTVISFSTKKGMPIEITLNKVIAKSAKVKTEQPKSMLYPNPASEQITIVAKSNLSSVNILSNQGQIIRTVTTFSGKKATIPLTGLKSGIYFVSIQTKDGNREVMKFIKE